MIDEVTIVAGGVAVGGWQSVRIARGIERMAADFDVALTERFPLQANDVSLPPGLPCEVRIGGDLVITGYIDRCRIGIDGRSHSVAVSGRSKTQDLIDCAALWPRQQMVATDVQDVAEKLATAYGIEVVCEIDDLVQVPQFNINKGETPFEIIDRWARFSAVLAYDDERGRLVIARTNRAKRRAAGGLEEGKNIESASLDFSSDQRFRDYVVYGTSLAQLTYFGDLKQVFSGTDEGVERPRTRYLIADHVQPYEDVAKRRLIWEINRRKARSAIASVRTDSWRDAAGALWEPNTLCTLRAPTCKLSAVDWLIGEVTFERGAEGTHATLVLMDPEGFAPEPMGYGSVLMRGDTQQAIR